MSTAPLKAVRRMREEAESERSGQKEGGIQLPSAPGQLCSFWYRNRKASKPEPLSFLSWPYIVRFHISWQLTRNGTQAKRSEDCILVRTSFPYTESVAAWHTSGITAVVWSKKGAEEESVCVWYSLSCPVSARGGSGGKGNAEVEAKAIGTERRA